jgi:hypothetical protein
VSCPCLSATNHLPPPVPVSSFMQLHPSNRSQIRRFNPLFARSSITAPILIADYDRIVVMKAGQVAESGPLHKLLDMAGGQFKSLVLRLARSPLTRRSGRALIDRSLPIQPTHPQQVPRVERSSCRDPNHFYSQRRDRLRIGYLTLVLGPLKTGRRLEQSNNLMNSRLLLPSVHSPFGS